MGARLETVVEAERETGYWNNKESPIGIAQFRAAPKSKRIAIVGTLADTMLGFRGELIKDFVKQGHQVFAFSTDYTEQTAQQIREIGATPVAYRMGQFSLNPFRELASIYQLYRLLQAHRIDLSYCYFSKPAVYGTIAAFIAKVPTRVAKIEGLGRVFTIGPNGQSLKKKIIAWVMKNLFRLALPLANHIIVLNEDDKRSLISFGVRKPEPLVINGIGVDLNLYRYTKPSCDPVRFIFVGRLLKEKGIEYFVDAAKLIKPLYPSTEFVILGAVDNNRGAITKQDIQQLVNEGVVTYPGPVKDVRPWLARSSVFVLPSYYREGVPRSTQEALAMGRAIITTDTPGCRATVRQGLNGILVKPHSAKALSQSMEWFLKNPKAILEFGECSRALAEAEFDVVKVNQKIIGSININSSKESRNMSHEETKFTGV
ncbi:glycosyltransferase family 4 protein [Marinobacter nauticus]|uniref:glycosyltransferase family 4 protein n=1 Tax=Marinobacter nauticus TaxID=2743 RepID=UPI000EB3A516|nr:glycosyltransferase family 4 protein [Marinobacter nauticus]RKR77545.1 glycosyltransferase involved in cell wall biosynthesis [Marinobacter nauticus]